MSQILYGKKHNRFIQVPLDWANCGTSANYKAHRRRGEEACEACKCANARYHQDYERRRKAVQS